MRRVEQLADVGAVGDAEVVGQGVVDRRGEVGLGPAGLAPLHVGERQLDHRLRRPLLRGSWSCARASSTACGDAGQAAVDVGADASRRPGRAAPRGSRRCATSPAGSCSVACCVSRSSSSPFGARPVAGLERLDQLLGLRGELPPARGDQVHRLLRDADDLAGLAVRAHRDQHPERVGRAAPRSRARRPPRRRAATGTGCARRGCATPRPGPATRLSIALWMCRCGSWSRESCWKNDATTQSCASTQRPAAPPWCPTRE